MTKRNSLDDRIKEINAFNELKRRGLAKGDPNKIDLSMGNYSRRLMDAEFMDGLGLCAK